MAEFGSGSAYRRDRLRAADHVLYDIRDQILSGRLQRGSRLPSEKELATHYDVSSPTIREAIRALSAMSLVTVRHGSGTFVTAESSLLMSSAIDAVVELERVSLADLFELSEVIYLKSVEIQLRESPGNSLDELRRAAESFESRMTDDEFETALRKFLTELVAISGNKLLIAIAGHLIETQIIGARRAAERNPQVWKKIAAPLRDERLAIVESIQRGDLDATQAAVRVYMERGRSLVMRYAASD